MTPDSHSAQAQRYSIAAVERDTGLSKDTLRVWERRYGFPQPGRDGAGDRSYPADQVERLRTIRRLMDAGHRPGRIVGLELAALQSLLAPSTAGVARDKPEDAEVDSLLAPCLDLLERHDVQGMRRTLGQAMLRMGMVDFVTQLVAPLTTAVGEAWMQGRFEVYEEHLYTECVTGVMRNAIGALAPPPGAAAPRVLLTTFPQEAHGLGLLMAEALLALEGCHCLPLGTQTPIADIAQAARVYRADIVALSFSGVMGAPTVYAGLKELRALLPAQVSVWVGGRGMAQQTRELPGVQPLPSLAQLRGAVAHWRSETGRANQTTTG